VTLSTVNLLLQIEYNISRRFLKTTLHNRVKQFKNVAIVLPIIDDKAVPNFYNNLVNC